MIAVSEYLNGISYGERRHCVYLCRAPIETRHREYCQLASEWSLYHSLQQYPSFFDNMGEGGIACCGKSHLGCCNLTVTVLYVGMGMICKNTNFCGIETDFCRWEICRRENFWGTKEKEVLVLALHRVPTFRAHSHVAIACLSHLNCEHSCWLWFSRADISGELYHSHMLLSHVLTKKKSKCSESFESHHVLL